MEKDGAEKMERAGKREGMEIKKEMERSVERYIYIRDI